MPHLMRNAPKIGQELRYRSRRVYVKDFHLAAIEVEDEQGNKFHPNHSDPDLVDPVEMVERKLDGF
jgi:hypothetical protein